MLYSAVRQDAKHGRQQISIAVRQSPARARYAPAKHAEIHGRHVMSVATLSMSQQDIDKVQLVGHFEEKKMYTIWFEVEGSGVSFMGTIEECRVVYDALKAAGVAMSCTRP